jgi:putative hemolysin
MSHAAELPVLDFAPEQSLVRFSYASDDDPWGKRSFIRAVERISGQPILRRAYESWIRTPQRGENIFAAGLRYLGIKLEVAGRGLSAIPKSGGLLVVANHPFGVADGLAVGQMLTSVRPDVKLLCHSLLCQPKEAANYLLPVDFGGSKEARINSARTRLAALEWLKSGGCLVVFPGGAVATRQEPMRGPAIEHPWHGFAGRLASVPNVSVLPVYFRGENSTLFHLASHFNYPLRVALLFRETLRLMGRKIEADVGAVVAGASLPHDQGRDAVAKHLHRLTLEAGLGTQPANLPSFVWPKRMGNP